MSPDSPSIGNTGSESFFEQVYEELRNLAAAKMSKEYVYSTLQGTALAHEAWLRLGGDDQPQWENRGHFFGAAAEAMRRILIDRARKRKRLKHGGQLQRTHVENLDSIGESVDLDDQLIQISEALEKLDALDSRKAELVKLRYFFGLSFEDTAKTMGISLSTAKRWWIYSKTWLHREIVRESKQ